MVKIVGVQFKETNRIYYFNSLNMVFKEGDKVIVDTVRGMEIGTVVLPTTEKSLKEIEYELKDVIRKATDRDLKNEIENEAKAKVAFEFFKEKVIECGLEMKPLYAEYTIDKSKVIFYYVADDRVDFRDLLKVLAPEFKTRVELRQIGPREAARVIGGLGPCGRELCCKKHLRNFNFVTMKMAKEQGMSLNTAKISGCCGKLMCCIAYENDLYKELKKELPGVGTFVRTNTCPRCKIVAVDYLKKIIRTQEGIDTMPVAHTMDEITVLEKLENENLVETEETVILDEDLNVENVIEEEKKEVSPKKEKYEKRMRKQRERKNK